MATTVLPSIKRRIVAIIKTHWYGISVHEIHRILYGGRARAPSIKTIKAHVWQLRRWHGLPIHSQPGGRRDGIYVWRL